MGKEGGVMARGTRLVTSGCDGYDAASRLLPALARLANQTPSVLPAAASTYPSSAGNR